MIFFMKVLFFHIIKPKKSLSLHVEDRYPIALITLRAFHHICFSLSFIKTQLIRAGTSFLNKIMPKALHNSANASHLYGEDAYQQEPKVVKRLKPDSHKSEAFTCRCQCLYILGRFHWRGQDSQDSQPRLLLFIFFFLSQCYQSFLTN